MATFYSNELTDARKDVRAKVSGNKMGNKVRVARFSWTGDAGQNDVVQLALVPKGAVILGGRVDFTAFGASATLDIGDETTENKFLSAADVASAGNADFANKVALGQYSAAAPHASAPGYPGYMVLTAKFEGANPASGTLTGHVLYVNEQ